MIRHENDDLDSRYIGPVRVRQSDSIDGVPTPVVKQLVKALSVLASYNIGLNTVEHYIEMESQRLREELLMLDQARDAAKRMLAKY